MPQRRFRLDRGTALSGGSSAGEGGCARGWLITGTNRLSGVLEALLFIGDRYEARVNLGSDDDVTVYIEAGVDLEEGQPVILEMPTNDLRVWPA
jgi:hypothetical protein